MNPRQASIEFIGTNTSYATADGGALPRLHLDGAASPLAAKSGLEAINRLLPHYSNSHSYVHSSAKISTKALEWAHSVTLDFVNADPSLYSSVFIGAGTTAAVNRIARGLSKARPEHRVVFVSAMEHHANDLPHRQFGNQVEYIPLESNGSLMGPVDLDSLRKLFEKHNGAVNYLAISEVSNVTGIRNPIEEITEIAHNYDAYVLVDGAQAVAHQQTDLNDLGADFYIFSGHKIYTPMAPGVLVAKNEILKKLDGQDLGGGAVSTVSFHDYEFVDSLSDREQAGTPNIVGAVALASVLTELKSVGMDVINRHDQELMSALIGGLNEFDDITVYGDPKQRRTGAIAFNHKKFDHGLLAAILNDYFAIAVRNECFCAHPYVSSLLKEELWDLDVDGVDENELENYINRKRGMVRASVSYYNTVADIERFIVALREIESNRNKYCANYVAEPDGSYNHISFSVSWEDVWKNK